MAAPNIVNVSSVYGKTMGATLGITSNTDILTCPANKVIKINSIILSNDGEATTGVFVNFYDDSASTRYNIANSIGIPLESTLVVIGKDSPIYLEESDQIEAYATFGNSLDMIISYEELDDA